MVCKEAQLNFQSRLLESYPDSVKTNRTNPCQCGVIPPSRELAIRLRFPRKNHRNRFIEEYPNVSAFSGPRSLRGSRHAPFRAYTNKCRHFLLPGVLSKSVTSKSRFRPEAEDDYRWLVYPRDDSEKPRRLAAAEFVRAFPRFPFGSRLTIASSTDVSLATLLTDFLPSRASAAVPSVPELSRPLRTHGLRRHAEIYGRNSYNRRHPKHRKYLCNASVTGVFQPVGSSKRVCSAWAGAVVPNGRRGITS